MVAVLELSLCDGLTVRRASGEQVDLPSRKSGLLLAFLAMQPGGRATREQAIARLWSDRGEAQARASMRQELLALRRFFSAFEPAPLRVEGEQLELDLEAAAVDAVTFERLCLSTETCDLERAVVMCKGEFLAGVPVRDPAGEEWLRAERGRLHSLFAGALERLLGNYLDDARLGAAKDTARRLIAVDPLRETGHRALIGLLAATEGRAQALRHFETARDLFRRELDVELEPATARLVQRIRASDSTDDVADLLAAVSPGENGARRLVASAAETPAIAILPFDLPQDDDNLRIFGDGLIDGITSALSRVRSLFVIARASTQKYRGTIQDLPQIGAELGVRYLLMGNLQAAGGRIRLRAQLAEASSGTMLWSDTWDGVLEDAFDLQDRMTERIVGAIAPSVRMAEIERARRKRPESLAAYDYVMRALPHIWAMSREDNAEALRLAGEAIRLDPGYAVAHAHASWCHFWAFANDWTASAEHSKAEAFRLIHAALRLDANDPAVLSIAALCATAIAGDLSSAKAYVDKALALDPNYAWGWNRAGYIAIYRDRIDEALACFERAARLSPFDPLTFNRQVGAALAHYCAGRYDEAVRQAELSRLERPGLPWAYRVLAAAQAELGRLESARMAAAVLLQNCPSLTVERVMKSMPFERADIRDRFAAAIAAAGIPRLTAGSAPAVPVPHEESIARQR